jgi:hypothetical protein
MSRKPRDRDPRITFLKKCLKHEAQPPEATEAYNVILNMILVLSDLAIMISDVNDP